MKIISHRGFWLSPQEKNSSQAFARSVTSGYGIETDIRDNNGQLVISHNMPLAGEPLMLFDEFLSLFMAGPDKNLPLAVNVKSDGLQKMIQELLSKHNCTNYFVFDMSIPDTLGYLKKRMHFFSRISEYEPAPAFYNEAAGIWVDAFTGTWYTPELIDQYLADDKQICLVSPELHQREPDSLWKLVKDTGWFRNQNVILCTDFPDKANKYFDI